MEGTTHSQNSPFLMSIQDIFKLTGRGTVVVGRVESGVLHVGDELEVVGNCPTQKTVCTKIEMFRTFLSEANVGDEVGVQLRDVKKEDIKGGQFLATPGTKKLPK